jgi:polysaccharide chain length determinant protein (PEP-CTERM system associated)
MIPGRHYTVGLATRVLWSRRYLILVAVAVTTLAAWGYASQLTDVFRSQATILVLPQRVPQNYVRSTVTQDLDAQLRDLQETVLSSGKVVELARALNLYPELRDDATAILQRFQSRLTVQIARADAFRITFVHRSPVLAANVVDRVAKGFVQESLEVRTGRAQETDRFMQDQLEATRERLAEHEQKLAAYRQQYSGQLPNQMDANLQVIQNAQSRLRALDESIESDRQQKLRTEQTIGALSTPEEETQTASGPNIDFEQVPEDALTLRGRDALRQLPVARSTLAKLELQLKPEHPDVVRLKRVITQLERRVKLDLGEGALDAAGARVDAARTRRIEQLKSEVAAIDAGISAKEAEHAQIREVIGRYQERVEMIPTRETELTTLMRDYDTLRETYRGLLAKKEETQMAAELERRQVGETMQIIEPARPAGSPFTPNRPRIVFSGAVLGLVLALAFTAWRELRDVTLRTQAEVMAALQLPVLGQIPVIAELEAPRWGRLARVALVSAALALLGMAWVLYVRFGPWL